MSLGCGSGGACCGSCAAKALVLPPVGLGEMGNPLALLTAAATAVGAVKGAGAAKDQKKAAQYAAEAAAIEAANNPVRIITQSPIALAGLGLLVIALLRR